MNKSVEEIPELPTSDLISILFDKRVGRKIRSAVVQELNRRIPVPSKVEE